MSGQRGLGYWAVIEHAASWPGDKAIVDRTAANGGRISEKDAQKIAADYKFARSFHGVAKRGYADIIDIINRIPVDNPQTVRERLNAAVAAVEDIKRLGYSSNPSAVSKWIWFRAPENWYIYDSQAADAVGAARSSVQGLRGFYAILAACGVQALHDKIAVAIADAGLDLRAERVIDKFLWLRGSPKDRAALLERIQHGDCARDPDLQKLARAVEALLPDTFFDF